MEASNNFITEELSLLNKNCEFIQRVLWLTGLNIFDDKFGTGSTLWYTIFIILLYNVTYYPNNIYYIYINFGNLMVITNSVSTLSTGIQTSIKFFEMIFSRNEIKKLQQMMKESYQKYIVCEEHKVIVRETLKSEQRVLKITFVLFVLGPVMFLATPIIFQDRSALPIFYHFPGMPYDYSPFYEINYFHQFVIMFIITFTLYGTDTSLVMYLMHVCSLVDILKYDISLLGNNEIVLNGFETDRKLLRRCYYMHLEIIEFVVFLRQSFKIIILVEFMSMVLILAMVSNVMAESLINSSYSYITGCTFQLLIYCYYGDLLKSKSDELLTNIYNNQWYQLDIPERHSLIIMMSNVQQPLVLTAGGFADLSLVSFVAIIKTAYSYFAVVRD